MAAKLAPEVIAQIKSLADQGKYIREIREELGVSEKAIRDHAPHAKKEKGGKKPFTWTPAELKNAVDYALYNLDNGYNIAA